jgi:hypothetical protein
LEEIATPGTPSPLHIATLNGEAMAFHDTIDLSDYAGALGDTTYMFEAEDGTGKICNAYIADAGEGALGDSTLPRLGSELVVNGDFSDWADPSVPDHWEKAETHNANNYVAEHIGGVQLISDGTLTGIEQGVESTIGSLYQKVCDITSTTTALRVFYNGNVYSLLASGHHEIIHNAAGGAQCKILRNHTTVATDAVIALNGMKHIEDVPDRGLRLVSTLNGSTRNMAFVETGFNPNTVTKLRIYRVK